jgi:streptogramin lyase
MSSRPLRSSAFMLLVVTFATGLMMAERAGIAAVTSGNATFSKPVLPRVLAAGTDGKVWFSDETTLPHSVGYFLPSGAVSTFPVPCAGCDASGNNDLAYIEGMSVAPDGNLWFLFTRVDGSGNFVDGGLNNYIGRMTPSGAFVQYSVPTRYAFRRFAFVVNGHATIAALPDGTLWFSEPYGNKIGKITPGGAITEFALPCTRTIPAFPENLVTARPTSITPGPDGNLWFTESECDRIGRMSPSGSLVEFPLTAGSTPVAITPGSDGNLWFLEYGTNKIGQMTPAGVMTELPLPAGPHVPASLVAAPDGNLWFTDFVSSSDRMTGQLGRIVLPVSPAGSPSIDFTSLGSGNKPYDLVVVPAAARQAAAGIRSDDESDGSYDLWMSVVNEGFADVLYHVESDTAGCSLRLALIPKNSFVGPGGTYQFALVASLGTPPYRLTASNLPDGATVNETAAGSMGITGEATHADEGKVFIFTITVTDAKGCRVSINGSLTVVQPSHRRAVVHGAVPR